MLWSGGSEWCRRSEVERGWAMVESVVCVAESGMDIMADDRCGRSGRLGAKCDKSVRVLTKCYLARTLPIVVCEILLSYRAAALTCVESRRANTKCLESCARLVGSVPNERSTMRSGTDSNHVSSSTLTQTSHNGSKASRLIAGHCRYVACYSGLNL